MRQKLSVYIDDHLRLLQEAQDLLCDGAVEIGQVIAGAFRDGGKLLIFGNGGSAADAQHLAAEFVNRYRLERPPLPAIALTTDSSTLTSIANDYEYRDVFAKQVRALGRQGDVALGITTSGNSTNVVEGLRAARELRLHTVCIGGRNGGEARKLADTVCLVPSEDTARIQELHLVLEHLICEYVEYALFLEPSTA